MGTLFERNGKWYVNYVFKGKRNKRMVGRSKTKAVEALRRIEADIVNDKFELPSRRKMSFQALADYWLEQHSKVNNAPSQYAKNKERIANHLKPFFGDTDIRDITPRMVDELKKGMFKLVKPATINRVLAILRKMFNDAVRWGFASSSPMRFVSQLHEPQQGFGFYSEDETRRFLQACSADFCPVALCAVYTGMRVGEIVALKWADVDLEKRVIRVERSGSGTTKSRRMRYIPINARLLEVMRKMSESGSGELVFPDRNGGMRTIDFRSETRQAAARAGVKRLRMHDLRHTFASNFVAKGGNLLSLQKILGHSTIGMTLRYAHLAPDFIAKEVDLLDFSGASPVRPQEREAVC